MKLMSFFLAVIILASCNFTDSYAVDSEKLFSSTAFEQTILISEVEISGYAENNYPILSSSTPFIYCVRNDWPGPERAKLINEYNEEVWKKEGKLVDQDGNIIDYGFRPQKEIFFYKKNKNYWWHKPEGDIDYEILPKEFKTNVWYKAFVSKTESSVHEVFFKMNHTGEVTSNHMITRIPTNF